MDVESNFIELFALVRISVSARFALPTPEHLLNRDFFACLKGPIRPLVTRFFACLHDHSCELVPHDRRKSCQSRVKDVSLFVSFSHVNITSANAADFYLNENLFFPWFWDLVFSNLHLGVLPDLASQVGLFSLNVF